MPDRRHDHEPDADRLSLAIAELFTATLCLTRVTHDPCAPTMTRDEAGFARSAIGTALYHLRTERRARELMADTTQGSEPSHEPGYSVDAAGTFQG